LVSVGIHFFVASVLLGPMTWNTFTYEDFGPPTPLALPWVYGVLGWTVLIVTLGFTALAIWLDRERTRRVDPLARIALAVSILGLAEAIAGARVAASVHAFPINLIGNSIWILSAAAALGVIAWIRILLSRRALRGRVFATCAIVCGACSAWIMDVFLTDPWLSPSQGDGIELAVADQSHATRPIPDEFFPEVAVTAAGVAEHVALLETARMMEVDHLPLEGRSLAVPDEFLVIRADAQANWSSVREVLAEAQEAHIWKIQLALRWEDPPALTHICLYMTLPAGPDYSPPAYDDPPLHLQLSADGVATMNGEGVTPEALAERIEQLWLLDGSERPLLAIEPDDATQWQAVVDILVARVPENLPVRLGPFYVWIA